MASYLQQDGNYLSPPLYLQQDGKDTITLPPQGLITGILFKEKLETQIAHYTPKACMSYAVCMYIICPLHVQYHICHAIYMYTVNCIGRSHTVPKIASRFRDKQLM